MGRKMRVKGKGTLVEGASTADPGPMPGSRPKPKPKPKHKSTHAASTTSKSIFEPASRVTPGSVLEPADPFLPRPGPPMPADSSLPRPRPPMPTFRPRKPKPVPAAAATATPESVIVSVDARLPPKPLVAAATVTPGSVLASTDVLLSRPPMSKLAPTAVTGPVFSQKPVYASELSSSERKAGFCKMEFVMRGLRFWRDGIRNNGLRLERNEYYRVYLQKDEFVAKPLFESQLSSLIRTPSVMHQCGSRIFNLSNLLMVDSNLIPHSLSLKGETIHCHNGVSWVDLNDRETPKKWHSGSSLENYKIRVEFAVLDDKIYCLIPHSRYYDTTLKRCHVYQCQLPNHLSSYEISKKIIPEPEKNRILVHLTKSTLKSPHLYAWHPRTGCWELITTEIDTPSWIDGSPILVDGVLYFYKYHPRTCFSAFDLGSNKWLQVRWPTPFPADAAYVKTDKMFYLGDGLVCLPSSRSIFIDQPPFDEWGIRIYFAVFHFHKTATPDDGPCIMFSHVFTKTLCVEHLVHAVDFLTPS